MTKYLSKPCSNITVHSVTNISLGKFGLSGFLSITCRNLLTLIHAWEEVSAGRVVQGQRAVSLSTTKENTASKRKTAKENKCIRTHFMVLTM